MKISGSNFINTAQNFKGNIIDFKPKAQASKSSKKAHINNPDYYQSINGIKKPSYTISVPLKSGEIISLGLDYDTITEYLSENGMPNPKLVKQFALFYADEFQSLTQSNEEIKKLNQSHLDNPFQAPDFMRKLPYKSQKKFNTSLLECNELEKKQIPQKSYDMTKKLFQLSKTKDGYDFSDIESKKEFIGIVNNVAGQFHGKPNLIFNSLIKNAVDKDGCFDFKLAYNSAKLMKDMGFYETPQFIINTVNHFCSKDKENTDSILHTMQELNQTSYSMDSKNNNFSRLMELCFTPDNKYSQKKADKMLEAVEEADLRMFNWLDENNSNFEYMDRYMNIAAGVIEDYFGLISNGNEDAMPVNKYIMSRMSNLRFI